MSVQSVCVYCGSSNHVDEAYKKTAQDIGAALAGNKMRLVYGGGNVGLMGLMANATLAAGGEVVGIIPEHIRAHEVQHTGLTELHVVDSMHTRKNLMVEKSDAFVILPGGFGTLDETFEVLTWKQLALHNKPIVIYNVNDFWTPLLGLIDHLIKSGFAPQNNYNIFKTATTVDELIKVLCEPVGPGIAPDGKWAYDPVCRTARVLGRKSLLPHFEKLRMPRGEQSLAVKGKELRKRLADGLANISKDDVRLAMRAAQRFGDNRIDDAKLEQILRRQTKSCRRLSRLRRAAPKNGGAAFRRNHRINRMLQHHDPIARRNRDRAAAAALADHNRDKRNFDGKTDLNGARDGFRLSPRLGLDARKRARRIHKRHDGQTETIRQIHETLRLAIAFGLGHAEIVTDAAFGIVAALLPDDDARLAFDATQTTDNGLILREQPVTREWREISHDLANVIEAMRTARMTRDLHFLRGRQFAVDAAQLPLHLFLKPFDFSGDVEAAVVGKMAKPFDLGFQFDDRFFKLENLHGVSTLLSLRIEVLPRKTYFAQIDVLTVNQITIIQGIHGVDRPAIVTGTATEKNEP